MAFESATISTAQVLTFKNGVINETYTVGGADVDMFAVDLIGGGMYEFDSDTGNDSFLRIFDAFGTEVTRNDDGADFSEVASTNPYTQFHANYTGRYYVAYSPYYMRDYDPTTTAGRTAPGNPLRTFTTTLTVTDNGTEFFPNSNSINVISAGSIDDETSGFASGGGPFRIEYSKPAFVGGNDVEMGRFDLAKGDVLVIDINGRDPVDPLDGVIRVFTAAGTQIGFDNGSGSGEDSELIFTAPTAGSYYIAVSGEGNVTYNPTDGSGVTAGDIGQFTAIIHRNPTLFGSSGVNSLIGTAGRDYMALLAGADTATGGDGMDTLAGGDDNDQLSGGNGKDVLYGEADNDLLNGDNGCDVLVGGSGLDQLFGGAMADLLEGGIDSDTLRGGFGDDTLRGGDGADLLQGEAGNNQLFGDLGNDNLVGSTGSDSLFGGNNDDTLSGGAGNDLMDGGSENDTLLGGAGLDTLLGGAGIDTLQGGLGNDRLESGLGDDLLSGGLDLDAFVFVDTTSGVDTVLDFALGSDRIDLSAIFAATRSVVTAGNLGSFVQTTAFGDGSETSVAVDADGSTGGLNYTIIAVVNDVTSVQMFDIANFIV